MESLEGVPINSMNFRAAGDSLGARSPDLARDRSGRFNFDPALSFIRGSNPREPVRVL